MPAAPPNAYPPGTKLTVGSHDVKIIKYISEGGFAHVYTCTIDPPYKSQDVACLKRVLVPTKWQLNLLRQEVDAMKRLRGNPTIVSYIDSHASRLNSGANGSSGNDGKQQYEVFLLMEYCSNNGLIDFMNTRLSHKLTEPEILVIMKDITLAVAMCHHLQPPLLHRDIKIENVLLDDKRTYKLCDFGSAVPYAPVPKTSQEFQLLKDDIMQHTTPQYRAPEMIDLTRKFPIDDKLDIWALGCFLYKLCYYTTPFELPNHTSLQDLETLILNCSHTLKLPHNMPGSMFSPRLKNIIKCCLREDPRRRPNASQLLEEICAMMNVKMPNVIPTSVLERPAGPALSQGQGHHFTQLSNQISQPASVKVGTSQVSVPKNDTTSINTSHSNKSAPNIEARKQSYNKPNDPFASIDKTRFLNQSQAIKNQPQRPKSYYGNINNDKHLPPKPPRPNSIYGSRDISPIESANNQSNASLKDYIQKQLSQSTENIPSRKSDDNDDKTLDFLKDMEDEYKFGIGSAQNTGGSFKSSFKNGLRRISTGSSASSIKSVNNTGNNNYVPNKRSSISSIKQILTGSGSRKTSNPSPEENNNNNTSGSSNGIQKVKSPEPSQSSQETPKKLSIQRRMAQYLNNNDSKSQPYKKTASGYGRFTTGPEESDTEDLDAINDSTLKSTNNTRHLKPPKVPLSLSSQKSKSMSPPVSNTAPASIKSSTHETPKGTSTSTNKKPPPPPKPKKPIYLRTPEKELTKERRLSDSSEISMPDVDDLEKQFAKRFPSYV